LSALLNNGMISGRAPTSESNSFTENQSGKKEVGALIFLFILPIGNAPVCKTTSRKFGSCQLTACFTVN